MTAGLLRADAVALPLADDSVDLIVTSPPYFALRSYTDGGEHYDGQIGSEATPAEFLAALWAVTAECKRVLKPSGSMFVNLGDKYSGSGGHNNSNLPGNTSRSRTAADVHASRRNAPDRYNQAADVRDKSLMGLPWLYVHGCTGALAALGGPDPGLDLIHRAEIVWCLSGGARVYARVNGKPRPMMVRDLARAYRPEAVELWNGEQWTQVLGWNRSADTDGAVELELRTGERIGCTRGHQWPTGRGLLRADELQVGDIIDTCRLPDERVWSPAALPADDIGWFVGLYLAEGSRSETTLQFAGHVDETERHYRLAMIADAYDGTCAVYQTSEHGSTCNMSGSVLRGIVDRYVSEGTAHTKRLTLHAWRRSDAFLAAVVTGYLDGDGHYDAKNDRWRLGFTSNDELAADLRTLAARLGAQIRLRRCPTGWRGEWRWHVADHANRKPPGEVVAIRASRARSFWDIGVADEPHLFALASGVLTHNSKPNGLPESVTDRVRRSHEQWFMFTKEPRYYSAVDVDPLGKLPGSVWTIPSEPLSVPTFVDGQPWGTRPVWGDSEGLRRLWRYAETRHGQGLPCDVWSIDHFAAFPQEWPRRLILGWSPPGICVECGEGRRPVVRRTFHGEYDASEATRQRERVKTMSGGVDKVTLGRTDDIERTVTGYACACPDTSAPTRPAVVLDPFGGTGTVAMVARALGRYGVHVDLSADYLRLARWRIHDSGHAAKSASRTATERQTELFGDAA